MKFAFLLAVLIALVAVSSAEWSMTAPKAADKWTPGAVADLKFTTSEEVDVDDVAAFTISYEKLWDVDFAVHGQGSFKYCYVGTASTVPVATVSAAAGTASVKLLAKVAKDAVVTCQVRVANKATETLNIGITGATVEVEITDSAPKVEVVTATANDDRSTNVELKFSGLVANSVFGPVKFGYKFKAATEVDITADARFYSQFLASDYKPVVFGTDVRILWQGTQAWIVTGAAPVDSTLALKYFDYELTARVAPTDRAEKYSAWASIEDNSADEAEIQLKEVSTVQTVEYNQAQISRAAGTITYGHVVQITADKPTWSFSISDYDADVVFGAGATLQYVIGGVAKQLTFTDKKFEYELTDAKAKDIVTVSGSFKVTDEFSKLTKVESKVDGKSASAQLVTGCGVTKSEIGSLKDGVIDYTLTIGGDKDFKGEVSCETWYPYALQQTVGDIRAVGEYTPSCEGTDASVSVKDKVTKDDADLNIRRLTISATLADGSKTATVKCTQKIGDAAAKRASKTVALAPGVTKDLLTAADTVKLRQKVIIKSRAITDSATFTAVLGEVVDALKAYDEDNFAKLVVGDFHYTSDVQQYSAGTLGFEFKFDTFANEYSNAGSIITLAFTATDQPDAPEALNVLADAVSTVLYGTGWQITLLAGGAGPFDAFKDAAVYLDGSVDATYLANQFVSHGLGVKCATTAQCAGGYCNKAVCTPLTQLTFAQQAAIAETDGGSSSSSALFTGLALLLAVIAIFA